MSHVPHELVAEFPELAAKISELKSKNHHFAKLHDEYHTINRAIHRAETDIEPTDDTNMEAMRKQRLKLKDELYSLLKA